MGNGQPASDSYCKCTEGEWLGKLSVIRLYYRQFVRPGALPIRYLPPRHRPRPYPEYRTVHPRRPQ